ncbi:hypothetical protein [Pseudomonas sp.]|uniref:hypothetical protein n=1 Tax=Pseudomonas sp. TaxID=306 RepID=UPI003D0D3A95
MHDDQELMSAVEALWGLSHPGPENLWSSQEFIVLQSLLGRRYGDAKTIFGIQLALGNALRSLGLPCLHPRQDRYQPLDLQKVVSDLVQAFTTKRVLRRHMCPLDLADDLPPLCFGSAKVGRFPPEELEIFFDAPRLARHFPDIPLDSRKLSQFHWLVVEEEVDGVGSPTSRALPFLEMDVRADLGEIDPHGSRLPAVVESALFFLLLAPWEQWAEMRQVDWRGFHLPWIYTVSDDLCESPKKPPDPATLSWQPGFYTDEQGETVELDEPVALFLNNGAAHGLKALTDSAWNTLQAARQTGLFNTPVEHFLVRAFLAKGMDEVLSHITAIEAALGMRVDHDSSRRPLVGAKNNPGATRRVASRLSAAMNDPGAAKDYIKLFDIRSTFVHGRAGLAPISTEHRILARHLARGAASSLVTLAGLGDSRNRTLERLLQNGFANLP